MKTIIDNQSSLSDVEAIERVVRVMVEGRVSGSGKKRQYCYHTVFTDGFSVSAFINKHSDRFVILNGR